MPPPLDSRHRTVAQHCPRYYKPDARECIGLFICARGEHVCLQEGAHEKAPHAQREIGLHLQFDLSDWTSPCRLVWACLPYFWMSFFPFSLSLMHSQ